MFLLADKRSESESNVVVSKVRSINIVNIKKWSSSIYLKITSYRYKTSTLRCEKKVKALMCIDVQEIPLTSDYEVWYYEVSLKINMWAENTV